MSIQLLLHFECIRTYGKFILCEPNFMILALETVGILIALDFSIHNTIEQIRTVGKPNKAQLSGIGLIYLNTERSTIKLLIISQVPPLTDIIMFCP